MILNSRLINYISYIYIFEKNIEEKRKKNKKKKVFIKEQRR